jgi:hypothetical protein
MPGPNKLHTSLALVAAGLVGLVGAACSLNPQPLPPIDDDRVGADPTTPNAGGTADGGSFAKDAGPPPPAPQDAAPSADAGRFDAAVDGGDGGGDATAMDASDDGG